MPIPQEHPGAVRKSTVGAWPANLPRELKDMRFGSVLSSPYVYVSFVPFLWSTNFVLGRVLVGLISIPMIVAIRITVAAVVLMFLLRLMEKRFPRPERKQQILLLVMGISGIFGFNFLLYTALWYTTALNCALINGLYPVLCAVLSVLVIKESFSARQLLGLIFSLIGVFLIVTQGYWGALATLRLNPGDILALLATAGWAVYSVAGKMVMPALSPLCVTAYSTVWGLVFIYPALLLGLLRRVPESLSWPELGVLVYLGMVPSVVAAFLWNRGVQEIGPERTSYFYNLLPVYSALLGIIFLGEEIHWYHLGGGALVACGVYLGSVKPDRKKTQALA